MYLSLTDNSRPINKLHCRDGQRMYLTRDYVELFYFFRLYFTNLHKHKMENETEKQEIAGQIVTFQQVGTRRTCKHKMLK